MDPVNLIALKHAIATMQQIFKRCGFGNIRIDIANKSFPTVRTVREWTMEAVQRIYFDEKMVGLIRDRLKHKYNTNFVDIVGAVLEDAARYKLGLPEK